MNESVNESVNETVNESASESVNKTMDKALKSDFFQANGFGFPDEPNDALAVLYGLTLALTAPDQDRLEKVAGLVADLFTRSNLNQQNLDTLKDAAVVLVEYQRENE